MQEQALLDCANTYVSSVSTQLKSVDSLKVRLTDLQSILDQKHSIISQLDSIQTSNLKLKQQLRMQLDALAEKDLKILKLRRELSESRKKCREVERSRKEMEGVVGEMKEKGREKEEGLQREMRVLRAENQGLRQRVLEVGGHVDQIFKVMKLNQRSMSTQIDEKFNLIKRIIIEKQNKEAAQKENVMKSMKLANYEINSLKLQLHQIKQQVFALFQQTNQQSIKSFTKLTQLVQSKQEQMDQVKERLQILTKQNQILKVKNFEMSSKINCISNEFELMTKLQSIYRPRLMTLSCINPQSTVNSSRKQ